MATRNAATSNFADVNNAVNGVGVGPYSTPAPDGDKVIIPNQPATWAQGLVVNKNIFLDFQGADITLSLPNPPGGGTAITLNTVARAVVTFPPLPRLSNVKLHPTSGGTAIRVAGPSKSVRIDHVQFFKGWGRTITSGGSSLGLVDHCWWHKEINGGETLTMDCPSFGGIGTKGDNSWAVPCAYGDENAWYFEDCIFANVIYGADGQQGGRTVYRHSLHFCSMQNHGTESGGNRGARNTDWYNNISFFNFANVSSTTNLSDAYASRAGTGVAFNNISSNFGRLFSGGVAYRMEENYAVWGVADGANLLDLNATGTINDFNNDPMVPVASGGGGGRGDIYAQGTSSGPQNVTTVYGGTRTFPVTAPRVNCFKGMSIRNITNTGQHNPAGRITGNTAGVGSCQISYESSNLPTTQQPVLFANSDHWEIRKVIALKDMVGRGQDDAYSTTGTSPSPQRWMNQPADGVWCWNNLFRPGRTGAFTKVQQGNGLIDANFKFTEQIKWGRELHDTKPLESRYHYDTTAADNDPGRRVGPDWNPTDIVYPQSFFMTDADADGLGHSAASFGMGATGVGGYTYPHPLALDTSSPTITNQISTTFQVGSFGSFQFTTSGFSGSVTFSKTGTLPSGVSLNPAGLLSGTPAGGTAGSYPINVTATAGAQTDTQAFILTVQAASTKIIGLSGSLAFGTVSINTTATRTLTIANTGNTDMSVTNVSGPTGYAYDWTHGTIPAGATQDVNVAFSPLSSIAYNGTVTVASDKTSGTNTIAVSGLGGDRIIALSGTLAFGNVTVGQMATRVLTITNNGNMALSLTSMAYPTGFSGNFTARTVAAGASTTVNITFAPVSAIAYSGVITVGSDATSGPNTIATSGTGVATPTKVIELSGSLDFGNVQTGTTQQKALTIHNSGNATLSVTALTCPTGFTPDWTSGTIAAGASHVVNVTFAPVSAISYSGTVTVTSDATAGANTTTASGTGVTPATRVIAVTGDMAFSNVNIGSSVTRILTITNSGSATLTVSGITYPTGYSGSFSGTIAPGASQDVNVTFTPVSAIAYNGTITVASDSTGGTNTIAASGTGVDSSTRIIALAGSLAYGNVQKHHTAQRTMTIVNTGTAPLAVSGITFPTAYSGDWTSGTIPAGATQNVVVTFAPVDAAQYNGTITVASNKTSGTNTIGVTGTGTNKRQVPFVMIVG